MEGDYPEDPVKKRNIEKVTSSRLKKVEMLVTWCCGLHGYESAYSEGAIELKQDPLDDLKHKVTQLKDRISCFASASIDRYFFF